MPPRTACVDAVAESSGRATIRPCRSVHIRNRSPCCGSLRPARTGPWCAVPSGAVQSARTRLRRSLPVEVSGSASSGEGSSLRTTVAVTRRRASCCVRTDCCSVSWAAPPTRNPATGATRRISSRAASATQASARSVARHSGLRRQRQSPLIARTDCTPFPLRDNPPRSPPRADPSKREAHHLSRVSHELLTQGQRPGPRRGSRPGRRPPARAARGS